MIIKIVLGKTKYTVCQKRANRVNKLYIKCNNKILIKTLTKGEEEKIILYFAEAHSKVTA